MVAPLSRDALPALLTRIHRILAAHRSEVDGLNVFPVPDGDTGTNLAHTVRAALEDLGDDDGDRTGEIAIRGAMRGARGNSGVILSQVVRALVETLVDDEPLDSAGFADFLALARDLAYEAVSEPVEGTILTVLTVAARTAQDAVDKELPALVRRVCEDVHIAVAKTPEQLEVLRRAGVVDAGARGLELVLDAVHGHLTGEDLDTSVGAPPASPATPVTERETGSLEYRFEVQYLLDADEQRAGELRSNLQDIGDSVVVVGAAGLLTVHVHTNEVGAAIEAGLRLGRPSQIQVAAFSDQIEEFGRRQEAGAAAAAGTGARPDPADHAQRRLVCVAVLPGPGLRAVAEQLGAVVVDGAAGALPSVADVLNAVGTARGDRIAILPGHRNVVPTARQAARVSVAEGGRTLDVIAAADSPPAVLSALAVCDPAADPEEVLDDMWAAAGAVVAGEVVAAVRDADTPIGPVRRGAFLAVVAGAVVAAHDDPLDALAAVARSELVAGGELVTVCIGEGVDAAERERAIALLRELHPDADVEALDGGQRPARYHLGIE